MCQADGVEFSPTRQRASTQPPQRPKLASGLPKSVLTREVALLLVAAAECQAHRATRGAHPLAAPPLVAAPLRRNAIPAAVQRGRQWLAIALHRPWMQIPSPQSRDSRWA